MISGRTETVLNGVHAAMLERIRGRGNTGRAGGCRALANHGGAATGAGIGGVKIDNGCAGGGFPSMGSADSFSAPGTPEEGNGGLACITRPFGAELSAMDQSNGPAPSLWITTVREDCSPAGTCSTNEVGDTRIPGGNCPSPRSTKATSPSSGSLLRRVNVPSTTPAPRRHRE